MIKFGYDWVYILRSLKVKKLLNTEKICVYINHYYFQKDNTSVLLFPTVTYDMLLLMWATILATAGQTRVFFSVISMI